MIVGTHPVENPHAKQAEQDRIVDLSPIDLPKPFHPTDTGGKGAWKPTETS